VGDEGWSGGGSDEDGAVNAPSKKHGGLNLWEKSKPHPEQRTDGGTDKVMDSKREKSKRFNIEGERRRHRDRTSGRRKTAETTTRLKSRRLKTIEGKL
jgi:hypothetical protein